MRLLSTIYLVKQCRQRNGEEDAEKPKMADAEEVDELRNWVVWHHTLDEVVLMHPTHRELVASQLHPHTVNRVFGNDKCLSYNELVVSIYAQLLASGIYREVVKGLAALQMKAVGREHEVVAHLIKRRIFLAVIARGEEKDGSHQTSPKGGFMNVASTHFELCLIWGKEFHFTSFAVELEAEPTPITQDEIERLLPPYDFSP